MTRLSTRLDNLEIGKKSSSVKKLKNAGNLVKNVCGESWS